VLAALLPLSLLVLLHLGLGGKGKGKGGLNYESTEAGEEAAPKASQRAPQHQHQQQNGGRREASSKDKDGGADGVRFMEACGELLPGAGATADGRARASSFCALIAAIRHPARRYHNRRSLWLITWRFQSDAPTCYLP
jgi:hypothetical protein